MSRTAPLVLAFVHFDDTAADHKARKAAILEEIPGARVVLRRGDVFTGWVEHNVAGNPVTAVDPGQFDEVAKAYAKAEIQIFEPKPKKAKAEKTPNPEPAKKAEPAPEAKAEPEKKPEADPGDPKAKTNEPKPKK